MAENHPPGQIYQQIVARDNARQHNGDVNSTVYINYKSEEDGREHQLLRSLSFKEMSVRHESIKQPAPRTLQ